MEDEKITRYTAYIGDDIAQDVGMAANEDKFRISLMTWFSLFFLLVLFPLISYPWMGDPSDMLKQFAESPFFLIGLIANIFILWGIFFMAWIAVWRENCDLSSIGFTKLRLIHVFWGVAFFGASLLILSGLVYALKFIGLEYPEDLGLLVPKSFEGKIVWFFLAITAGITEEAVFRGYLITRLQKIGKTTKWLVPGIIASVAFGMGHTYQGLGGFVVITVYGAMFAALYWKTNSIWPCIIAHSLQDLIHLFVPFPE